MICVDVEQCKVRRPNATATCGSFQISTGQGDYPVTPFASKRVHDEYKGARNVAAAPMRGTDAGRCWPYIWRVACVSVSSVPAGAPRIH